MRTAKTKDLALLAAAALLAVPLSAMAQEYTITDLGRLGGPSSEGAGINASGQVTGDSYTSGGGDHALVYSNGTMHELGTLGGTNSFGYAINASGQVVGYSDTANAAEHAFLYSNGTMRDLGTLGGTDSFAYAINTSGQVTGWAYAAGEAEQRAFLYSGGQMLDLNSLIPAAAQSLYTLSQALGINDSGQIVADGYVDATSEVQAFFLTPVPSPATACFLVIGLGAIGALTRRNSDARGTAFGRDRRLSH